MVPIASLMIIATLPGQTVIVSQFNTAIRDSLSLSLEAIADAYFVGTVLAALPLTLVGRLADRVGPRAATALVTMAFVVGTLTVANARGVLSLTAGFFLIRLLGQGALGMLSSHVLALWFERRLGTVESIKHGCMSVAGAVVPLAVVWSIGEHGWRETYAWLGVIVALVILPLVATAFRNRPEDIGQHLDNEPPGYHARWRAAKRRRDEIEPDRVFTLRQTLRTRAFWLLLPTGILSGLVGTAMLFHIQPILEAVTGGDTDRAIRAGAESVQAWSILLFVGLMLGGVLADRFPVRTLLPIGGLGTGLSALVMALMTQPWHAIAAMGVFGLAQGIGMAAAGPAFARFFGRPHHGAIRGFVTTAMVAGTALGPVLLARAAGLASGDFTPGLLAFAIASMPVLIGAAVVVRPPVPGPDTDG